MLISENHVIIACCGDVWAERRLKNMIVNFLAGHSIIDVHKTGVQIHDINIIKSLIELGYTVKIYDFKKKEDYNYEELMTTNDPQILNAVVFSKISARFSKRLPLQFAFGNDAPKKNEICIVDSCIPIGLQKQNSYAILHDLMPKIYPDYYQNLIDENAYMKGISQLKGIWANSKSTQKDYLKYYDVDECKLNIVPCCIPDDYGTQIISQSTKMKKKDFCFYYIGDMRKNKNLAVAIKSFAAFVNREMKKDCYFVIAGKKGKEYEELYKLVQQLHCEEQIRFVGYISDLEKANLIANADCLLFISEYEGFGIPVIEAMACGVPVITSDCSSLKEIGSGAALLVNPSNEKEVQEAIKTMYYRTIDVDSLIENGYKRSKEYSRTTQKNTIKQLLG